MIKKYAVLIALLFYANIHADSLAKGLLASVGLVKGNKENDQAIVVSLSTIEGMKVALRSLQEIKKRYENEETEFQEFIEARLKKLNQKIAHVENDMNDVSEDDRVLTQKLRDVLKDNKQIILDLKNSQRDIISILNQQIKVVEKHLKDPQFKSLVISASINSFDDFQKNNQQITRSLQEIASLEDQVSRINVDLETFQQDEKIARDSLRDQNQLREELGERISEDDESLYLDLKLQGRIVDSTFNLLNDKLLFFEKKVEELNRKKVLMHDIELEIGKDRLHFFEEERAKIRRTLHIEDLEVQRARTSLNNARKDSDQAIQSYKDDKDKIISEREEIKKKCSELAEDSLGISFGDDNSLSSIAFEPQTSQDYSTLSNLLECKSRLILMNKNIELIDVQNTLLKSQLQYQEAMTNILDSWYKITKRMFRSDEEVEQDVREYKQVLERLELDLKRDAIHSFFFGKDVEIIARYQGDFENRKKELASNKNKVDSTKTSGHFKKAIELAHEQSSVNSKIRDVYSKIATIRHDIKRDISSILGELKALRLRPAHAISWIGVKNFIPDLDLFRSTFIKHGAVFLRHFAITAIALNLKQLGLGGLLVLLLRILLIIMAYVLLRFIFPRLRHYASLAPHGETILFYISRASVLVLDFVDTYFNRIFAWFLVYFLIHIGTIQDVFLRSLFYLVSIPYIIVLIRQFMRFFVAFDREQEYLFFTEALHQRIKSLAYILVYATTSIFCFREAFILMAYSKSELPTILLAIYSIIIRLVLISLVSKEDILEIIPTTHYVWEWIRKQVEDNYYPIYVSLVALILLSEPHIGYGSHISYVLWGIIGTAILIRFMIFLHLYIRDTSSRLFFNREGEVLRERFSYSRSAYGMFTIVTFVILGIVLFLFGAKIWGYSMTLSDLYGKLEFELFSISDGTGYPKPITIVSLLQVLFFIVISFVFSYGFNRFVLKRTFSLLMVVPGVQHTISTISHYIIVLIFILIGCQRVGLGGMILWSIVAPLILALAFSVKDSANDFVSYFIILVQRPFKIGDFVQMDGNTMGVVRKITPRSVIVRSKNSVTVLIPNSKVVKGEIHNWNYTRGFSAFDDIMFAIPYTEDPARARTLLYRVLDENVDILKNPRPIVRLNYFGQEGFVFMIRAFHSTVNVLNRYDIASDVRFSIAKSFKEADIQIVTAINLIKKTKL